MASFDMAIFRRFGPAITVPRTGQLVRSWCGQLGHFQAGTLECTRLALTRPVQHRGISSTQATPRIHVLGLGSVGAFTAHSLAEIPARPAVNLLLHRPSLVQDYVQNGNRIRLKTHQGQNVAQTGYDLEVLHGKTWHLMQDSRTYGAAEILQSVGTPIDENIGDLIVCVKSTQTVAALRPLLPRLSRESNVMFLQNGAGMIEDANTFLWPDPHVRPNYVTGVISHGITLNRPFDITHTGPAATSVGPVPREDGDTAQPLSRLLDILPLAHRLKCQAYSWPTIVSVPVQASREAHTDLVHPPPASGPTREARLQRAQQPYLCTRRRSDCLHPQHSRNQHETHAGNLIRHSRSA